jgi:hypothetical protein
MNQKRSRKRRGLIKPAKRWGMMEVVYHSPKLATPNKEYLCLAYRHSSHTLPSDNDSRTRIKWQSPDAPSPTWYDFCARGRWITVRRCGEAPPISAVVRAFEDFMANHGVTRLEYEQRWERRKRRHGGEDIYVYSAIWVASRPKG